MTCMYTCTFAKEQLLHDHALLTRVQLALRRLVYLTTSLQLMVTAICVYACHCVVVALCLLSISQKVALY
jgi:hypothetical protein